MAAVPAGQTASYALWLQDVGFAGTVEVSCSGLPAGAKCSGPQGLVLTPGSGIVSVWVTVATGPDLTARARQDNSSEVRWGWVVLLLPLPWRRWWWTRRGERQRRRILKKRLIVTGMLMGICLATGGGVAGCGSNSGAVGATVAPGTYTFTITAAGTTTGTTTGTGKGAAMTATLVVEQ
jgi:hypothetical protein